MAMMLLLLLITQQTTKAAEIGEIRSVEQVVDQSSSVYQVGVDEIVTHGCGNFVKYKVRVMRVFKGQAKEGSTYDVCGYPGLSTAFSYIIGLEVNDAVNKQFFYPDAIFIERLPGEYYRAISYQSNVYTSGNDEYLLAGIGVPNLEDIIQRAASKKAGGKDR
jgi:hypothetical protein